MESEKYGLNEENISTAAVEKAIAQIYSAGDRRNEIPSLSGALESLNQAFYERPECLLDLASDLGFKKAPDVSTAYQMIYSIVKRYYLDTGLIASDDYSKIIELNSSGVIFPKGFGSDDPPSFPPLAPKQVIRVEINRPVKEKSLEQLC
ncbi:MAG: hypothetical protein KKA62_04010 [Nanoarchaeota archaeon]|nr:hypothetical protein [Nanoarchaeota archaeon]MBU1643993.1 hypothetical protein [Nanoarchaeota archaeon]MBU1977088.1 hypothetical protein [Nanoarchaeota archaeon]